MSEGPGPGINWLSKGFWPNFQIKIIFLSFFGIILINYAIYFEGSSQIHNYKKVISDFERFIEILKI